MSNVLWDEWLDLLSPIAAKWCADDGSVVDHGNGAVRWTCPLGSLSVSLEVRASSGGMNPRLWVGSASTSSGNAHLTRRRLMSGIDTINKAEAAFCEVDEYVVWWRDCPCDQCSGSGGRPGIPCRHCSGTGKRNPTEEESTP